MTDAPTYSVIPSAKRIIGYFEEYSGGRAKGWAADLTDASAPVSVAVYVDGKFEGLLTCSHNRADVQIALGIQPIDVGFEYCVPRRFRDGFDHCLSFLSVFGDALPFLDGGPASEARPFCCFKETFPRSVRAIVPLTRAEARRDPAWGTFDVDWYRATLTGLSSSGSALELERYYQLTGMGSPNAHFDEEWYVRMYPEVRGLVQRGDFKTGFEHYCSVGHTTYDGHWLFDTQYYLDSNADLSPDGIRAGGYFNSYDHYLSVGQHEHRRCHRLFDELIYRTALSEAEEDLADKIGIFSHYLCYFVRRGLDPAVSYYFDPKWYRERYMLDEDILGRSRWRGSLHHYLGSCGTEQLDPLPIFDEVYYRATYPDVDRAIMDEAYLNGFDHFLKAGLSEYRSPSPLIPSVSREFEEDDHDYDDTPNLNWFLRNVRGMTPNRSTPRARYKEPLNETATRSLYRDDAHALLASVARRPLEFSYDGRAELSVIMVVHNQFELTIKTLQSLRQNSCHRIQLIIVDSGSTDSTIQLEQFVGGVRLLRFQRNIGYLLGSNKALALVEAEATLFLNNDVRLHGGAIDWALQRLASDKQIGAVGAKIIRTNGLLQEAGGIVWRDGRTSGYLRGSSPNAPEANFVRTVDFCSAAFLMVKTAIVKALDGFDVAYRPAYFEDTDLCVRMSQLGFYVVYDPVVVVEHYEYASSDRLRSQQWMERAHRIFRKKHREWLRSRLPNGCRTQHLARGTCSSKGRVLFIDDRVPLHNRGAGYGRANDIVNAISRLGYHVVVFPLQKTFEPVGIIYHNFRESVEVLYDRSVDQLEEFLDERPGGFDVVWVSRTHNIARVLQIIQAYPAACPPSRLVFDTEAIAASRSIQRAGVLHRKFSDDLLDRVRDELVGAEYAQVLIAVNEREALLVRLAGYSNVAVLGHVVAARPTSADWCDRQHLLFVGSFHEETSPNFDSMVWFLTHVWPLLLQKRASLRLTVAGYVAPAVDTSAISRVGGVDFVGFQADLTHLYDTHRVFVAPTRFSAGIPYKVHEAASFGLPCVVSEGLRNQLGWQPYRQIMIGDTNDPSQFAARVLELYERRELWYQVREGALEAILVGQSAEAYEKQLERVLQDALSPKVI